jgi:hypothetical protein
MGITAVFHHDETVDGVATIVSPLGVGSSIYFSAEGIVGKRSVSIPKNYLTLINSRETSRTIDVEWDYPKAYELSTNKKFMTKRVGAGAVEDDME